MPLPKEGKPFLKMMEDAVREANSKKQAELLVPISQLKVWEQAFQSLNTKDIPAQADWHTFALRMREATGGLELFSAVFLLSQEASTQAALRVLCKGFETIWPSAWAWIQFLDPLSGPLDLQPNDHFLLSCTVPGALVAALLLAFKDGSRQTLATLGGEPLEKMLALWYHDYGIDASNAALVEIERGDDLGVHLRNQGSQHILARYLLQRDSPYHERTVEVLHRLCGGRPGRIRRRLLLNLERGLRSRHSIDNGEFSRTYTEALVRLYDVPAETYYIPPPSKRTVRRITGHLLRLSQVPDTTIRAVSMCTVLLCFCKREGGERIVRLALPNGLLVGLRNIVSHLPLLPPSKVNNCPKIGETFLTIITTAIRLRRVTREMVRETDILLASAKVSESNILPMRWAQFLEAKKMHTSAWKAFRKRLNTVRRCRHLECTEQAPSVRSCVCREVYYCSKDCQRKHWRQHRMECPGERMRELTLEDRIYLEEVTRCHASNNYTHLTQKIGRPEIMAKIKKGCDFKMHVLYDEGTPNVKFKVNTVNGGAGGDAGRVMLYLVGHLKYGEVEYTLKLDPEPLEGFVPAVARQLIHRLRPRA
uniref:MYND-type domain-containing protein n=1 Tax=Schizophyllum commune (strain H4-8 / FGSC 9210) TaxID=578458 RepID=D8Q817_SCHCM